MPEFLVFNLEKVKRALSTEEQVQLNKIVEKVKDKTEYLVVSKKEPYIGDLIKLVQHGEKLKTHYTIQLQCTNCNFRWAVYVPKGVQTETKDKMIFIEGTEIVCPKCSTSESIHKIPNQ